MTPYKWMANRKGGEPSGRHESALGGQSSPVPAWQILVTSGRHRVHLHRARDLHEPGLQELAFGRQAEAEPAISRLATTRRTDTITVTGSSDGEFKITEAGLPGVQGQCCRSERALAQ